MSIQRYATPLSAALLLAACGGGGGSGSEVPLPGGADTADADACGNAYYRELMGTYRGQAVYDPGAVAPTAIARCVWTMTVVVEPESSLFQCRLRMVTSSELEQSTVLPADDDDAYQCVEENGVRALYEPNQSTDPTTFENVSFPVNADAERRVNVPPAGPYFGDDSFSVRNLYLFDSTSALVDGVQFDGQGAMRLVDASLDGRFLNALLRKD